jgi:hypothetical protein
MRSLHIKLELEQHRCAAYLAHQAQQSLEALMRLVHRAPFTDRALDVMGAVDEYLIEALREGWEESKFWRSEENPYPSMGYGGPRTVRRKIRPKEGPEAEQETT